VGAAAGIDGDGVTQTRGRWLALVAGAALLLAYPFVFTGAFAERIGALVLLSAIGASAWNILGGYAGQISVGHAVFYGIGAYMPLLFYTLWGVPPLFGVPAAVAVSLVVATLIGFPTFRLTGHYFSMATIAVAELVRIIVSNWDFVGAAIGLMGPATSRTVFDLSFKSAVPYYYIFLAVLAVVLGVTWWFGRSRMGYYLRALKGNERAARSLGVPVRRYKLFALLLSAGFTAVAGSLYALMVGFIDPDSGFGILVSVDMIIIAALGGAGTLFGPLLGAVILVPLREFTNAAFGGGGSGLTYILFGGIIMILSRFEPGGLLELGQRVMQRLQPRTAPSTPAVEVSDRAA
jgi:branched-chain amino acid transport system permease protein